MKLTREDVLSTLERAGHQFSSEGFHLYLRAEKSGVTRFANNEVTDNQYFSDAELSIRAYIGMRAGTASVNQLDMEAIQRGVRRAEEVARSSPEDPEFVGPPGLQTYPSVNGYDEATASTSPAERASHAADIIAACKRRRLTAAGCIQTTEELVATHASSGSTGYHRRTTARFSMTARTDREAASGWVLQWATALGSLNIPALARTAMDKGEASKNPQDIKPGRYTVVLEPVACEHLLWNLTEHLDARAAEDGRSFLSRFDTAGRPAGTRLGEQVFSPLFTVARRVNDPAIQAHPFDPEGTALHDLTLVRHGVLENLSYDRYWAQQKNVRPTGELRGVRMEGTGKTVPDLVREAGDGILITRLWYIRSVDPMKTSVTGMTRDGTFRIEGGEIAGPVKNLRFNEELSRVFDSLTAVGTAERFWDFLTPGIVVPDFHFTSTTESI